MRLFGRPVLERDGRAVHAPRGRKTWALLAYLLLAERPPSRQRLASLLFTDADDPLRALRWNLSELRRALTDAATIAGDPVCLRLHDGHRTDVHLLRSGHGWDEGELERLGGDLHVPTGCPRAATAGPSGRHRRARDEATLPRYRWARRRHARHAAPGDSSLLTRRATCRGSAASDQLDGRVITERLDGLHEPNGDVAGLEHPREPIRDLAQLGEPTSAITRRRAAAVAAVADRAALGAHGLRDQRIGQAGGPTDANGFVGEGRRHAATPPPRRTFSSGSRGLITVRRRRGRSPRGWCGRQRPSRGRRRGGRACPGRG